MPSPLPRWVRWADRSWLGLFHPVASSPSDIGLPHMSDGSAPTSSFFEACSAFTHVTACLLATSPSDVFSRRLRRFCHLHRRSDSYRLERPSCRMGIAPIEEPNLSRRTDMHFIVTDGVSGSQNESHFGRAIRAILRAVNRSFGSSLSLSPYPWRARGIASKVISYTCRSIGSG